MSKILVEVCCGSAGDAVRAKEGGAQRIELNSALFLGGLTPSLGLAKTAVAAGLPVMAMVRPREGAFCYDNDDFKTMLADADALLSAGAQGIVFGILQPNGTVDRARCAEMLRVIGGAESIFHRAIDVVPSWARALDELIDLGFRRVLTSGQAQSARDGAAIIRQMIARAAGRIEISPGGGIRLNNLQEVLAETGCDQIHVSMRSPRVDPSAAAVPGVHFNGAVYLPEDTYSATDAEKLRAFMAAL